MAEKEERSKIIKEAVMALRRADRANFRVRIYTRIGLVVQSVGLLRASLFFYRKAREDSWRVIEIVEHAEECLEQFRGPGV